MNLKQNEKNTKTEILSWIKTLSISILLALFITNFIVINARVPSSSMENTIMIGDRLFASRLSYIKKSPERFDIIVFKYPDDESLLYVKRVIGLPGDKIEIIDGKVFINNSSSPIPDNYLKEETEGSYGPYFVPKGHYFVLGDNRNNSNDSRFWNNTYLSEDKILGKALFKYFPNIKMIDN